MTSMRDLDHIAGIARQHQHDILREVRRSGGEQAGARVRATMFLALCCAVPVAWLIVRMW